jgi:hypothetical protein
MQGDIKSRNLPVIVGEDDHYIQPSKLGASHDRHVDGSDSLGLIEQEATPGRGRRTASSGHVSRDRSLADLEAELEEFAVNPRRAPKCVGAAHLTNYLTNFAIYRWTVV